MSKRMIFNLITLLVTTFLLIFSAMAWYVTNKTVSANGISGSVVGDTDVVEEVNIYYATKNNNGTYTKGDKVTGTDYMIYDQFSEVYEASEHGGIQYREPARLIELVLKTGTQVNQLKMVTTTTRFPGTDNTTDPGYITSNVDVPLSPFIMFNKATVSGTTITVSSFLGYEYNTTTGAITSAEIQLINSATTSVYILVDFDDEKFNLLYSNNIGNSVIDDNNQIIHIRDFKMLVFGGDA